MPQRAATSRSTTRCSAAGRSTTTGGRRSTFHPLMLAPYDGSDPRRPFDEDPWELYHVAEDFAETTDLAEKEPDRLADDDRALVERGRAQPGPPDHEHAGTARRPALPPQPLRVLRRHQLAARRSGAEPAQPVVADDRRDRQHERRRCRRDREPRQRERWVRGLRQGRTPLLRGELPRHRDHDRARWTSICRGLGSR